jgi:Spy/CpxP family protein refolding chaperone
MQPLRLLTATLVVAVAGSFAHAAMAAPHDGMGGPGHHGAMDGPGMGDFGMGGPGMGRGHQMDRMLDLVNASAEQRAQIKQIQQAAQTDLQAQHEAARKLREQSQALFAQPTVDARAVEALRQQMLAQHDQSSKRMTQALLDVSRVLTVEQRKVLADRMGKRRAMMERHRAEREATEPAPKPR